MITIAKTFRFEASHRLTGLEPGHKCMRLHGHSYAVTLWLHAEHQDERGMVLDYGELQPFRDYIDLYLDHRHLGVGGVFDAGGNLTDEAVFGFNPTAENLAVELLAAAEKMFGSLVKAVRVKETAGTMALVTR